jgi:glycosyltransferase involved in cell wall biosynthesis/SAM-dependent methyltransferase
MRRFLFVIHYPIFGGPHNQALRLDAALSRRGWDGIVLLPEERGNAAERLKEAGVKVVQLPLQRLRARPDPWLQLRFGLGLFREVAQIRRLIRQSGIDLVLVGGLVNPHAAIAARLEGIPVVWQLLDTRAPMVVRRAMMPVVRRLADAILTTGTGVAASHPKAMTMGDRLIPYFPPVDVSLFRPNRGQRTAAREELGLRDDDLVIGNVSNVTPQKGHQTFLSAAGYVHRKYPTVRFVILGANDHNHGKYVTGLWDQAEKEGLRLGKELIVREPGSRVPDLAAALDIFWLTSEPRSEGIPTVVEEAMALGLPVITVDVGGVREAVTHGVTGFVAPAHRPEVVAEETYPLLADAGLRQSIGEAARLWAVDHCAIEICADVHARAFEVAIAHHSNDTGTISVRPVEDKSRTQAELPTHRELLVCPSCHGSLAWSADEISCAGCFRRFAITDGIPVLVVDVDPSAHDEHDELAHLGANHKNRQANFFDREQAAEFEIVRPHGAPTLYRWLLEEKFRRGVAGVASTLRGSGAKALVVCGGSGMDAEFLTSTGARVITSDISIGAAQRARERARRYGLPIMAIVADVEQLPFGDRAVDLVYVHDGLHHLTDPETGLREMTRVAAEAISINEPARAVATTAAVRLGLALEREEAGNSVVRMKRSEIESLLVSGGFRIVCTQRYAMYYRHHPGRVFSLLSSGMCLPVAKVALQILNRFAGGLGNKLTVQAIRSGA